MAETTSCTVDLTIKQGKTWHLKAYYKDEDGNPINLTGYTIRSQARPNVESSTILINISSATPVAGITVGPLDASGLIEITLSANYTAALNFAYAVYDMEAVSPSGYVTEVLSGTMTLKREVTR